ncbi:phosphoribosylanthranilate isomerase [Clostridium collagenovorans DSM 3089]|uniref:N-(5'-phosphoribosyl)anthranilate isomerase n=1 Tax=Clostridium collagenovorans DSM 3089 TaxID=1121306 RepID=A0A1M5UV75_9CLOT|nr:phosphoribosylanthranilate isomerase [Clostridium collagenovorans]SHH66758.1 phosphoribosylanthranilate isomerase [Clostridium collagenovorans DSM 3089]
MKVKICGLRKIEEIEYVNILKPDYIGFVFAESKRKVSIEKAKVLIKELDKSIKSVGVFRNNSAEEILQVLDKVDLDVVQLHGDEDENFIKRIKSSCKKDIHIWKAIFIGKKGEVVSPYIEEVNAIVLDGVDPGSGECFPWDKFNKKELNENIFLAGGIKEENILKAIEIIKPKGIDVSSGVEIIDEKGERVKSFEKIKRLIELVRCNYEG